MSTLTSIIATVTTEKDYPTGLPDVAADGAHLHTILELALAVLAAVAVFSIVVSGLRYVLSQGNPQEVAKAKSTIVYSLIGLLVAVLAEAIVSLALSNI